MKRLVVDLDGTLTIPESGVPYGDLQPDLEFVSALRRYKADGFEVVIATARNMRTHSNSVGKITAHTLPGIVQWLQNHNIPYDEIHIGKPWCGDDGFYVDDRSVRPSEFKDLTYEEIIHLLGVG